MPPPTSALTWVTTGATTGATTWATTGATTWPSPLALAGLAVVLALASGLVALPAGRAPWLLRRVSLPLLGLAGVAACAAGVGALVTGTVETATLPLGLPWLPWHLRLDGLSGWFLAIIGVVTAAVGLYGPAYVRGFEQGRDALALLGLCSGLFVAGMLLVVLADDAFLFMIAWELMSLASYFLVAFHHEQSASRRAAFLYLLMAQIGGLAILLGFGVLAAFGGGFDFTALRAAGLTPVWAGVAFALAFVGFGMKAGLVPLHAWLPLAHPAAPSHISALMSAVMLKVAVYGFLRVVFDLIGAPLHWSWGVALILVGGASAVLGALYALVQTDLKRLLAYSSVENLGVIFVALGLAILFIHADLLALGALALVAGLYHALNHAVFKALLFLAAGAILHSTHERDLEQMGGLLRRLPWTGLFFLIGVLSIAGLPPFNGFVSEWLLFQAALQSWQLDSGVLRSLVPIAAAALALTAALVAVTFVKVFGVAFLGQARSRHIRHARRAPLGMRAAQAGLAVLCLLLGVLPVAVIGLAEAVPRLLFGVGLPQAGAHGWLWLTPIAAATASYSAPLVVLLLFGIGGVTLVLFKRLFRRTRRERVRRCDPWDCGFAPPTPRMQVTASGFAQPLRRVFAPVFLLTETLTPPGAPGAPDAPDARGRWQVQIADRAWGLVYLPVARLIDQAARRVVRLQSGHVRVYLGWTLATLVLLLWIIT